MIGYILTNEQSQVIDKQFYSNNQFFYCSQDVNGIWFILLSEDDKKVIANTNYEWILDCPQAEFIPPPPPLF
jgi:hypothetical protein